MVVVEEVTGRFGKPAVVMEGLVISAGPPVLHYQSRESVIGLLVH